MPSARCTPKDAKTNCYSLTDASGNGYGLCLNYNDGKLYLNRRTTWGITNLGTATTFHDGTHSNSWLTLQLTKVGSQLTAKAIAKPSPQAHRLPSARMASEWREPVAMATAPSKTRPQRSALSPRPCDASGP